MSYSYPPHSGSGSRRRGPFRSIRRMMPKGVMPSGSGLLARNRGLRLLGLGIGLLAVLTTLSLLTFNAADPSLNTATTRAAQNWIGTPGAFVADALLQSFGVSAYLVPLILAHWAFVCLFLLHRSAVTLRLLVSVPAILMLAAVLSSLPFQSDWTKPASAGGAGGLLVLENFQRWLFLPKALSTVLCFVGGAMGLIYALGLDGSLMPRGDRQRDDAEEDEGFHDTETAGFARKAGPFTGQFTGPDTGPVSGEGWSDLDDDFAAHGPDEFYEDEEVQEVYSDPAAVRVRHATRAAMIGTKVDVAECHRTRHR